MDMKLTNFIVQKDATVIDAASVMDSNAKQIVFICDGMRLLAAFADGDLRRVLLKSGNLTQPVIYVANDKPISVEVGENSKAKRLLEENPYMHGIPLLNASGDIVSIEFTDKASIHRDISLQVPVVIMAGGKGTRLAPYTDVLPKSLIPVGDITITEHIMKRFLRFGCDDFIMILNHKRELIKAYFNEIPFCGKLRFVDEVDFQGTGGGLKLLEGMFDSTFFVTNCDILIDSDYEDILNHHRQSGALITLVCAIKKVVVAYGTVELDKTGRPINILEKPEYPLLTNTGLYVVEPSFLEAIPNDSFIHITELIQKLMDEGKPVGVYPVGEASWLDMGQIDELNKMREAIKSQGQIVV